MQSIRQPLAQIDDAIELLGRAKTMLEQGRLEDYLTYYQTGYRWNSRHLLSYIVTSNQVSANFIELMNERLKDTCFAIGGGSVGDEDPVFHIYHKGGIMAGVSWLGHYMIGELNPCKREGRIQLWAGFLTHPKESLETLQQKRKKPRDYTEQQQQLQREIERYEDIAENYPKLYEVLTNLGFTGLWTPERLAELA